MEVPHSTKASTFHSTQAQFTEVSTQIRGDLEKVKLELNQASFVAPETLVKGFIDKLSHAIEMHNLLITPHLPADTKIRLNGLQKTAEKSAELLQDVTNLSRKYANEIIEQAMRAHLYEENITFPDGAIAPYHADSVHPQLPPTPTLSCSTGMIGNELESQHILYLSPLSGFDHLESFSSATVTTFDRPYNTAPPSPDSPYGRENGQSRWFS